MALQIGSITVNTKTGQETTTPGMATSIYTQRVARLTFPDPATPPDDWAGYGESPSWYTGTSWLTLEPDYQWRLFAIHLTVVAKQALANECVDLATGIIASITTDAEIEVTVTAGNLQTLPTTILAGEPTDPPDSPQTLSGTIT